MDLAGLDRKIVERGKEFFASISGEAPSIFNKSWWTGKVMDWSMKNENFKIQLFRFVDVLPYLNTSESLTRHTNEYFAGDDQDVPKVLRLDAGAMGVVVQPLGQHLAIQGDQSANEGLLVPNNNNLRNQQVSILVVQFLTE